MTTERAELPEYADSEEAQFAEQVNAVSKALDKIVALFKQVTTLPAEHLKGRLLRSTANLGNEVYYDDGATYVPLTWKNVTASASSELKQTEAQGGQENRRIHYQLSAAEAEGEGQENWLPKEPSDRALIKISSQRVKREGPLAKIKTNVTSKEVIELSNGQTVEEFYIKRGGTVTCRYHTGRWHISGDYVGNKTQLSGSLIEAVAGGVSVENHTFAAVNFDRHIAVNVEATTAGTPTIELWVKEPEGGNEAEFDHVDGAVKEARHVLRAFVPAGHQFYVKTTTGGQKLTVLGPASIWV